MTAELFKTEKHILVEVEQPLYEMSEPDIEQIREHADQLFSFKPIMDHFSFGEDGQSPLDIVGVDEHNRLVIIRFKRPGDNNTIAEAIHGASRVSKLKSEIEDAYSARYSEYADINTADPSVVCFGMFSDIDLTVAEQSKTHIILHTLGMVNGNVYLRRFLFENRAEEENTEMEEQEPKEQPQSLIDLDAASDGLKRLYYDLKGFILELGEDTRFIPRKNYFSFKRKTSLADIYFRNRDNKLSLRVKVSSNYTKDFDFEDGFSRDISHSGYGRIELTIRTAEHLEKAKQILRHAYEQDEQGEQE